MATGNGASAQMQRIFIQQIIARSISEDGRTALIAVVADKKEMHITCPIAALSALRAVVNDLIADAANRSLKPGDVLPIYPQQFQVGHTEEMRNIVVTTFDPETPNERCFFMPNQMGLKLAKMLKADIMPRLTDRERIEAVVDEARIEPSPRSKLILPPGVA